MRYKVILGPSAQRKITEILHTIKTYYQDIYVIRNARDELSNAIDSLDIFPERGPIIKSTTSGVALRKLITKHYILLYQINNDSVQIVDILIQKQQRKV